MTAIAKTIFDHFEIRKSKKQKTKFLRWAKGTLEQKGYSVAIEKGSFGSRNLVIGDVEQAKVVFTAHYDTCAVMPVPNFITPKNVLFYWLYQMLICIPIFAVIFGCTWLAAQIDPALMLVGYWLSFLGVMGLMMCGPANKHTANDNTSGVITVLELALALPEEYRSKVAFVLFDLEEAGLLGSASFAKKHRKEMQDKPLINLDCVSDGDTMLFVAKKKAAAYLPALQQAFPSDEYVTADFASKGVFYPSDQANFPHGIGVAALKKSKSGILYMDRIHTKRDTVYRKENIRFLVCGCIRLIINL